MRTKILHCEFRDKYYNKDGSLNCHKTREKDYIIEASGNKFLVDDKWLVAKDGYNFDPVNIECFSDYDNRNWENDDVAEEMVMSYTVELEENMLHVGRMDITVREKDGVIVNIGLE